MRRVLVGLLSGLLASCAQNSFQFKTQEELYGVAPALIFINGGALYTNNLGVQVSVQSPDTVKMKLSLNATCPGDWSDQSAVVPFAIRDENAVNTVYGKFQSRNGYETDCIKASIVHDNKNPWVNIVEQPADPSPTNNSKFKFDGGDTGSGLDYFECQVTTGVYIPCSPFSNFSGLVDGHHKLLVRAVDRAGNRSDSDNAGWLIDTTPPEVTITKGPPQSSNSNSANFEFLADDKGGSGIAKVICQVGPVLRDPCPTSLFIAGLTPGTHALQVWAQDRAGHISRKITYDWSVDDVPSGDFTIIGVESPATDLRIDAWLNGVTPTAHWTRSDGANEYLVSILSESGANVVCSEQITTQLVYAFPSSCRLADLTPYKVQVTARDAAGNTRTKTFNFTVDRTPPIIDIAAPVLSGDQKQATIDFSVSDLAPGVLASAICYQTDFENGQPKVVQQDCFGQTQLTFTGLTPGDHKFKIVALDVADNTSEKEITFKTQQVICDPFAGPLGLCKGGLVGEIYYLNQAQQSTFNSLRPKTVNFYFTDGTKLNAVVNLLSLFGSTRRFNLGFPTADGNLVKDDQGNTLVEYFAFNLATVIHLDVDNSDVSKRDEPGYYQFATISDDGTLLNVKRTVTGTWEVLVNNDGNHATRMGCATDTIQFDADTRLPAQIQYYQGPRDYIALTLMWRKVSGPIPQESYCGQASSDLFFGPYPHDDFSNAHAFGQLTERGWKVLSERNFIAPQ
jgi:hypothetical protein